MKKTKVRYIVCYMFEKVINPKSIFARLGLFPDYECFETLKEAQLRFKELCDKDNLYSANITKIMASTDY